MPLYLRSHTPASLFSWVPPNSSRTHLHGSTRYTMTADDDSFLRTDHSHIWWNYKSHVQYSIHTFCVITLTSSWPRWRLKSPALWLFTQPFIQTQIKENLKAPRHWLLCGEFTGTGLFPAQRASYAENASIWWRHHVLKSHGLHGDYLYHSIQPWPYWEEVNCSYQTDLRKEPLSVQPFFGRSPIPKIEISRINITWIKNTNL